MFHVLVTNNPRFQETPPQGMTVRSIPEWAASVIRAARDLIHQGWLLANHPLYGNFLPRQTPYRSLVLTFRGRALSRGVASVDETSLDLIEQAQARYASAVYGAARLDGKALRDCAFVDVELLRATIESLGCSIENLSNPNGRRPALASDAFSHHKEI